MIHRLWLSAACLILLWLTALLCGGASLPLDTTVLDWLHPENRDGAVDLAWAISWLGDGAVLIPIAAVSAVFLMARRRGGDALALIAATASVRLLVTVQKDWFGHARPGVLHWTPESSSGFPSGHAANSFITWVALAMLFGGSRRAVAAAVMLSALVGVSRIVLGVHWPTDVIGGWALGALAALILWRGRIRLARPAPAP